MAYRGIVTTQIIAEGYQEVQVEGKAWGDHVAVGLGHYSDQVFVKIAESPSFF